MSAAAVGWLLGRFRGLDGRGGVVGGKREREKIERHRERVREGEGRDSEQEIPVEILR